MQFDLVLTILIIMKKILILFVLFFSSAVVAEVYYCSESYSKGLDNDREHINFIKERYIVNINWQEETISSEKLDLNPNNSACMTKLLFDNSTYILCVDKLGVTFAFNRDSKEFSTSSMFLNQDRSYKQSISLGYGTCDNF